MLEQSIQSSSKISALIALAVNAELSGDEQRYLDKWLDESQANKDLYNRLTNEALRKQDLQVLNSFNTSSALAKLTNIINKPIRTKKITPIYYYMAAAIALLTLTTVFFYNQYKETAVQNLTAKMNTVNTPVGVEQQIVLPDGTKVRLSAASSLSYPSSFDNSPYRTIKLIGQAYFEVTKDTAQPFLVQTKLQEIEVMGTTFKVESYTNEDEVKTSLYSGTIKIKRANKTDIVLSPGQQSLVSNFAIRIIKLEPDAEGGFTEEGANDIHFKNEEFPQVVRKLERWYDVDIQYSDQIKTNKISGGISKSGTPAELSTILTALYPDLRFTYSGKIITVKSSK